MFKKIIIVPFLWCFFSVQVLAALPQSIGPYVEVNAGSNNDFNLAINANVGYKINDFLAVEGGGQAYANEDDNHYLFDFAIKGIIPFSTGWDVFAKFGAAEAHGCSRFEPVIYYGAGVGYSFTQNLTGLLQWTATSENNGVKAPVLLLIGLNYIF